MIDDEYCTCLLIKFASVCVSVCLCVIKKPEFLEIQNRHYLSSPLTNKAQISNLGYLAENNDICRDMSMYANNVLMYI